MASQLSSGTLLPVQGVLSGIIERRSAAYDVVYFYGKSTATKAVIDDLLQDYSSCNRYANTIRLTGETFLEKQLQNIRSGNHSTVPWEKELRACNLFAFEEIDKVAGLQTVEQALYRLLDWLLEHNVQIVITGSVPISHMDKLAPRIRAQLDGGISCQVI